jgi:hypothetical protein
MVMACAFGGTFELLDRHTHPVTILVRRPSNVTRFELFDCVAEANADRHCFDRRAYRPLAQLSATPVFGAGIHRIITANATEDRHYFVRAHLPNGWRDSDIIHAKLSSEPTQHTAGALRFDHGPPPTFHWPKHPHRSHWVAFLLVRERRPITEPALLTAVYSWAERWPFPDVRSAPFYYHDPDPEPRLLPNHDYDAWWFDVDRDGWISQIDLCRFATPRSDFAPALYR